MKEHEINKLIEETLSSIDNIKRADASHINTDKILTKIKISVALNLKNETLNLKLLYRAAAVFILLFSINVFTWAHITNLKNKYEKINYNYTVESVAKNYFKNF